MKSLTKKQVEIIKGIKNYLNIDLNSKSFYVKNKVLEIDSKEFSQANIRDIENYGTQFKYFSTDIVMNGNRLYLNLIV